MYVPLSQKIPVISLPHGKILDWSKLRAFADDKINAAETLKFILGKGRKHCETRRKCWLHDFLIFPQCFQKAFFSSSLKVWIVW